MTDLEILKELKQVKRRIAEVERKVENYLLDRHNENADAISTTESALMEVASITDNQATSIMDVENALMEVAGMVAELTEAASVQ